MSLDTLSLNYKVWSYDNNNEYNEKASYTRIKSDNNYIPFQLYMKLQLVVK